MKRKFIWIIIGWLTITYVLVVYLNRSVILKPINWDELIGKYYLSQDITYEVNGHRLFLSDSEIHTAAGYLYLKGLDPTKINFQHPPLLKYGFGYAALWTGSPLSGQVLLGYFFILLTFYVGLKVYHHAGIAGVAAMGLMLDPLFQSMLHELLLDLGQAVLILLYFITLLIWQRKYWLSGLTLGLLIGAKFWGASLFFIVMFGIYLIWSKSFRIKNYFIHLLFALITLQVIYLPSLAYQQGKFNLIWFQGKLLKYWLHHSVAAKGGEALKLFITGQMTTWWGIQSVLKTPNWTVIWPIMWFINLISLFIERNRIKPSLERLIIIIPITYLIYLSIQAPFERYFIVILPFLYLGTVSVIFRMVKKII